jgi:hypothetical protein
MRKIRTIAVCLLLAACVGFAFTLPAGAAVSQQSRPVAAVQVQSPGMLVARGAAVIVPVLLVCQPGGTADYNLNLSQVVGNDTALGFGSGSAACTGGIQIVDIVATATEGEPGTGVHAFRKGNAVASVALNVCTQAACIQAEDGRTINLTKKP